MIGVLNGNPVLEARKTARLHAVGGLDGRDGRNGADGKDGANGKSAYAYAREGGYRGTEGAFAAKLAETNLFSSYDRFADSVARMRVNPQEPLAIVTYDGSNKPTHPSALYIPEGWNGHRYWLAYTPFPNNDNQYENPCLAYSDDGVSFSSAGLTNPVEDYPTENGVKVGFNSDVEIVLVDGVLECWWRTCQQSGTRPGYEIIYRKKGTPTEDGGIAWSEKEELYAVENAGFAKCLSPAVLYRDGKYHIWYCWLLSKLVYCTSTDGTNWTQVREIDVDQTLYPDYKIWHFDILYTEGIGYEFVGSYRLEGDAGSNRYVFYARSRDNVTYTPPILILTCGDEGNFDDTELYRPTIIREPTGVKIYYGCRSGYGNWRIGMIEAPNPYLFHSILQRRAWEAHVEEKLAEINAVPCTGITLDRSELTFTVAASQTLTATVAPAHTTDKLTWSVSPAGIVTVTDGVVAPAADVRSGECVVTATCGAYSASCAVTLKIPSANLFDDVTWEAGTINASGADAAKSDNRRSGYVDVTHLRGTDILLYAKGGHTTAGNLALFFYDESKVFLSTLATTNDTKRCLTCTVPENAAYLRVAVYTNAGALERVVLYSGNTVAPSTLATQQTGKYYNTTDGALKSGSSYNCYAIPVHTNAGFLFVSYAYSAVRLASNGSYVGNYVINTTNTAAYTGFSALENDGYLGLNVQAANTDKCLVKMPTHLLGSKEF